MDGLNAAFLHWPHTRALVAAFAAKGAPLRFVGGCVRDSLLAREVRDVDAATPLAPDAVMALLAQADIRALPTGLAHGTVTAVVDGHSFEITTLRRDVATDGRHAEVAFTDDWQEDAARRDFTMNALYLSPQGELFDYFGGETDARAGRVQFIGDAQARIREDYLRLLRLFRFHAWYGSAPIAAGVLAVCASEAAHIARLSGERIQKEMLKLLAAPDPGPSLAAMQDCGVAAQVFDGGADVAALSRALSFEKNIAPLARLARLLGDDSKRRARVAERWRLSGDDAALLAALRCNLSPSRPAMELREFRRRHGEAVYRESAAISAASAADLAALLAVPAPPPFPVSGRDLKALGIPEGQALGAQLRALEAAWVASGYMLTKDALLAQAGEKS